ncbi:MAG TPA: OmpA family protein [Acetobacteraceae bacterium]|nr:OmpA family protein [Acetobacteraceae bacterium]
MAPAAVLSCATQAQPVTSFYVGAGAGLNLRQEQDIGLSAPAGLPPGFAPIRRTDALASGLGVIGSVSLGYGFGNGLRAEIEASYRQNEVERIGTFGRTGTTAASGDTRTYGGMLNLLYDLDLGVPVVPYLGAGIGWMRQDYMGVRVGQRGTAEGEIFLPGSEWDVAYQAMLGAALPMSVLPGFSVTAEYRFLGQPGLDRRGDVLFVPPNAPAARGSFSAAENYNHSVMLGVRYAFGQTPPPPVVAPSAPVAQAPAPARSYLVFFDFNRTDLNDRARQIIGEAAQNAQRGGTTRIEVSGHADRSGTPQYNQRLSERRAQAVAAELERRGIARNQMAIQAFGESRPLVPTADGVREPQNRRVEIVLR